MFYSVIYALFRYTLIRYIYVYIYIVTNWNAVIMRKRNILCKSTDMFSKCKILENKITQNELPNINLWTGVKYVCIRIKKISISRTKPRIRNISQTEP